jgi:hypothetical protein
LVFAIFVEKNKKLNNFFLSKYNSSFSVISSKQALIMDTNFQDNVLPFIPENEPVLCIPRVYPNISEGRIRHVFGELNLGKIDHIDLVKKVNEEGKKYNMVFVHFRFWKDNENAIVARERLLQGKQIKVIYDEPWFWKISAYKSPKRTNRKSREHHQRGGNPIPILELDSEEEEQMRREPRSHYERPRDKVRQSNNKRSNNSGYKPRKKTQNYEPTTPPLSPRGDIEKEDYEDYEDYEETEEGEEKEEANYMRFQNGDTDHGSEFRELDYGDVSLKPKSTKGKMKYVPRQVKVNLQDSSSLVKVNTEN